MRGPHFQRWEALQTYGGNKDDKQQQFGRQVRRALQNGAYPSFGNDLDIFYREAGAKDAPVILLLHGFPTSSSQFRNLIPRLASSFRLIAPDYPGYGQSSMPDRSKFSYTFDNFAAIVDQLLGQGRHQQIHDLHLRLRGPGWLSPRSVASGACHRTHRAERERLRGGVA
jgi:predicted dienelactone hydrolase